MAETATDPVCGMAVDTQRPPAMGEYGGQKVYFCSQACRATYEKRRSRYS